MLFRSIDTNNILGQWRHSERATSPVSTTSQKPAERLVDSEAAPNVVASRRRTKGLEGNSAHGHGTPSTALQKPSRLTMVLKETGGWASHSRRCFEGYNLLASETQSFFSGAETLKANFCNANARESGWAMIDPHRERLFLRAPVEDAPLGQALGHFAAWAHKLACEALTSIALSLGMSANALVDLAEPWPPREDELSQNILRTFRYAPASKAAAQVLTEAHSDLGLLAVGLRSFPGLEVFEPRNESWTQIEAKRENHEPVIMVGRSLALLTRGALPSCAHRVTGEQNERMSWVFHVRLKSNGIISPESLSSPLLEPVFPEVAGLSGRELTAKLWRSVTNANGIESSSGKRQVPFDQLVFRAAAARRAQASVNKQA